MNVVRQVNEESNQIRIRSHSILQRASNRVLLVCLNFMRHRKNRTDCTSPSDACLCYCVCLSKSECKPTNTTLISSSSNFHFVRILQLKSTRATDLGTYIHEEGSAWLELTLLNIDLCGPSRSYIYSKLDGIRLSNSSRFSEELRILSLLKINFKSADSAGEKLVMQNCKRRNRSF